MSTSENVSKLRKKNITILQPLCTEKRVIVTNQ